MLLLSEDVAFDIRQVSEVRSPRLTLYAQMNKNGYFLIRKFHVWCERNDKPKFDTWSGGPCKALIDLGVEVSRTTTGKPSLQTTLWKLISYHDTRFWLMHSKLTIRSLPIKLSSDLCTTFNRIFLLAILLLDLRKTRNLIDKTLWKQISTYHTAENGFHINFFAGVS